MNLNNSPQSRPFILFRIILLITLVWSVLCLYLVLKPVYEAGILFISRRWMVFIGLSFSLIILQIYLLLASWTRRKNRIFVFLDKALQKSHPLRWLNFVVFIFLVGFFSYFIFSPHGQGIQSLIVRLFLFWITALLGSFFLKAWSLKKEKDFQRIWLEYFGISALLAAFIYTIAYFLTDITTYPFTLGWSETSRYYYASLFFSRSVYNISVPPSILHPSRYLMQSLPFIFPDTPLWIHRAWQVFLWLAVPLLTAFVLVYRNRPIDRWLHWVLPIWLFLYIMLGPIYYHLLAPVIVVLLGFNAHKIKPKRLRFASSLAALFLASAWAGISRVNWFPVPGLLAAALILLEEPISQDTSPPHNLELPSQYPTRRIFDRHSLHYVSKLAAWFLFAISVAFASQSLYIVLSGTPADDYTTSFSSDLLWYRLLPNITYPPGILTGILIISLPLFLLVYASLSGKKDGILNWFMYHPIRLLGLGTILSVLFIGGLVVSVKIGGGSNLHNMDAYILLLLVITIYFQLNRTIPDQRGTIQINSPADTTSPNRSSNEGRKRHADPQALLFKTQRVGVVLAIIIPVFFTLVSRNPPSPAPDESTVSKSLERITRIVNEVNHKGGDILFISNRHLLTFKYFPDVQLIPEYERMALMEMAMAANLDYLGKFYEDLSNQRFELIISEPFYSRQKDETAIFGEENNAWVERVSKYVLCNYEERRIARDVHIQLLVPKDEVSDCP